MNGERVYSVHSTRECGVGTIEIICEGEHEACRYALQRSTDAGITAAVVNWFVVGQLGSRHLRCWYVRGQYFSLADRGDPDSRLVGWDPRAEGRQPTHDHA